MRLTALAALATTLSRYSMVKVAATSPSSINAVASAARSVAATANPLEGAIAKAQRRELKREQKKAIALASEHQLVTPVTGAVVLETQEQYDEMGLTPVPFDAVPSIPEPSTWALWCVGFILMLWGRHCSQRARKLG